MRAVDSFNTSETTFNYPWPKGITGLERIFLSAQGDLQRLLSAFFAQSIIVERVSVSTSPRTSQASLSFPIVQTRKINLLCQGRIVGYANSTVTITSPECERLFLDEKYAIGQIFRVRQKVPQFTLVAVGFDEVDKKDSEGDREGYKPQLWRRYTLSMEGFDCEIIETFPDRSLFVEGFSADEVILDVKATKHQDSASDSD